MLYARNLEIACPIIAYFLLLFLVHVSVLVSGDRYATRLAVTDLLVSYAQVHAKNLLLARFRVRPNYLRFNTIPNNIQSQAQWNYALLQGVSVDICLFHCLFLFFYMASTKSCTEFFKQILSIKIKKIISKYLCIKIIYFYFNEYYMPLKFDRIFSERPVSFFSFHLATTPRRIVPSDLFHTRLLFTLKQIFHSVLSLSYSYFGCLIFILSTLILLILLNLQNIIRYIKYILIDLLTSIKRFREY